MSHRHTIASYLDTFAAGKPHRFTLRGHVFGVLPLAESFIITEFDPTASNPWTEWPMLHSATAPACDGLPRRVAALDCADWLEAEIERRANRLHIIEHDVETIPA